MRGACQCLRRKTFVSDSSLNWPSCLSRLANDSSDSWEGPGSGWGVNGWESDCLISLGQVCGWNGCFSCCALPFPWGFLPLPVVWDFSWFFLSTNFLTFSTIEFCVCFLLSSLLPVFGLFWAWFSTVLSVFCFFWVWFSTLWSVFLPDCCCALFRTILPVLASSWTWLSLWIFWSVLASCRTWFLTIFLPVFASARAWIGSAWSGSMFLPASKFSSTNSSASYSSSISSIPTGGCVGLFSGS